MNLGVSGKRWMISLLLLFPALATAQSRNEIVLPEGTRITLQLNDNLSTKKNDEGDSFSATVTSAVYLKERLAIPEGSIVSGSISHLLKPGRFKGKAMMTLLFSTLRLQGSPDLPIVATLVKVGEEGNAETRGEGTIRPENSKGKDITKVAAPAVTGAGIGAIIDGGRGAAIGGSIGAAVGLLFNRGTDVELKRGCTLEIVLDRSLCIK
jgi:hypothetical protein